LRDLPGLLGGIFEKSADAGQLACRRRRAKALCAPLREESAQVRGAQAVQIGRIDRPATMPLEEFDQAMRSRGIRPHRVRRAAAVVLEMGRPARCERARRGI